MPTKLAGLNPHTWSQLLQYDDCCRSNNMRWNNQSFWVLTSGTCPQFYCSKYNVKHKYWDPKSLEWWGLGGPGRGSGVMVVVSEWGYKYGCGCQSVSYKKEIVARRYVKIPELWLVWHCLCLVKNAQTRRVTRKETVVGNLQVAVYENMEKYFSENKIYIYELIT